MNQSIGFLAIELGTDTESNFIVNYINSLAAHFPYTDMILFNSVYNRVDNSINRFATIHINEAKFFTGPIIAFNLKNMLFLKHCIGKKIFYALRPEWDGLAKNINYQDLKSLYVDTPDTLFVPTEKDAEIFSLCWREPIVLEPKDYSKVGDYAGI